MTPPLDPSLFPVRERWTYLNHATMCAPPTPVIDAAHAFNLDVAETGGVRYLDRVEQVRAVRPMLAALLGVEPDDLAFTKNATEATSWIANGMEWAAGDRVVLAAHDFPSTRGPFLALRRRGIEIVDLPPVDDHQGVPLEDVEQALAAGRVRLVALSWVQTGRGARVDAAALAALCHEHGARLVLDAIQGVGVLPCRLAEWGVDAAALGSHKWVLAPEGAGALWVAPSMQGELDVSEVGWRWFGTEAGEGAFARPPEATMQRFEGGTLNGAGLAALGAGIELLLGPGIDAVWAHVDALCDRLVTAVQDCGASVLSDRSTGGRSAIVSVAFPEVDPEALVAQLGQHGVAVSARAGGLRFSPHAWNTAEEVDRAVSVAARLARGQR